MSARQYILHDIIMNKGSMVKELTLCRIRPYEQLNPFHNKWSTESSGFPYKTHSLDLHCNWDTRYLLVQHNLHINSTSALSKH